MRAPSEPEIDLAHHLGSVEADLVLHRDASDCAAESLIAVEGPASLDAEADIVGEGVLEAAAHRAAGHRVVISSGAQADERDAGLALRPGNAAGRVQQDAVERVPDAATQRRLPVAFDAERVA